ncbi:MAG: peptidylprolyl isomerase [Hyphomicrobium sp.]
MALEISVAGPPPADRLTRSTRKRRRNGGRSVWTSLAAVLAVLSVCIVMGHGSRAVAQESLGIAAVVNDDVISVHDLAMRVALLLATTGQQNTPENRQRAAPHVLRMLIDEKLKVQEAKRLNIQVTRAEVDRALGEISRQIGVSPQDLPRLLASGGVSISTLMEQVEAEIAWVKAVSQQAEARGTVSDEDVDAEIQRIEERAGRPEFRIAEIFLPLDDSRPEAEIEALGRRIMDQLRQGAAFPVLARNYSAAASAAMGGDLGWLDLEQLPPELQASVSNLTPGEVVGPIKTLTGYHIVLMIDRRTAQGINGGGNTVTVQQISIAGAAQGEESRQDDLLRIRELTSDARSCGDLEAAARGATGASSKRLDAVELSEMEPVLREKVQGLEVGQPSEPFESEGGVAVLMVCERTGASPPAQLRERVRRSLVNERLEANAQRMLRNLRREAFVDVKL